MDIDNVCYLNLVHLFFTCRWNKRIYILIFDWSTSCSCRSQFTKVQNFRLIFRVQTVLDLWDSEPKSFLTQNSVSFIAHQRHLYTVSYANFNYLDNIDSLCEDCYSNSSEPICFCVKLTWRHNRWLDRLLLEHINI